MTGGMCLIRAGDKSYYPGDTDTRPGTRAASGLMRGSWRPMWGMGGAAIQSSHRVSTTQFHKPIQDANLPIRKHCASSSQVILSNNHCNSWYPSVIISQWEGGTVGLWPIRGRDTVSGQHLASGGSCCIIATLSLIEHHKQFPVSRTFLSSWFLFRFLLNVTTCHQPIRGLPHDLVTNERPPPVQVLSVSRWPLVTR